MPIIEGQQAVEQQGSIHKVAPAGIATAQSSSRYSNSPEQQQSGTAGIATAHSSSRVAPAGTATAQSSSRVAQHV